MDVEVLMFLVYEGLFWLDDIGNVIEQFEYLDGMLDWCIVENIFCQYGEQGFFDVENIFWMYEEIVYDWIGYLIDELGKFFWVVFYQGIEVF